MINFEWDPRKARANLKDHGISFEEARSVFYDDYAIQFFDEEHSSAEDRFLMLGLSNQLRILMVVHCYRESDEVIRIISARAATRTEKSHYKGPGV